MKDLILAIDQGTTGTTALLVDASVTVLGTCNVEFPNHCQNLERWRHDVSGPDSVRASVERVLAKTGVNPERIAGIGIAINGKPLFFGIKRQARPRTVHWCGRIDAQRTYVRP